MPMRRFFSAVLDRLFPIRVEARCEADELMEALGDGAYSEARRLAREAEQNGDLRRAKVLWRARYEIGTRTDPLYGMDTATRYLEAKPLPPRRPPNETLH